MDTLRLFSLSLVMALILLILPGCRTYSGDRSENLQWSRQNGSLGKVALIVTASPTQDISGINRRKRAAHVIGNAAQAALDKLPNTSVLDPVTDFVTDLSDRDALALAKQRGAQSVCILSVALFGGRFSIDVWPPGWSLRYDFQYVVRVLDVPSGDLLVHVLSDSTSGGPLAFYSSQADALKSLAVDLSPRLPRADKPSPATHP